jgi:hypothetical protein
MRFLNEKLELGYENMSSFGSSLRVAKEKGEKERKRRGRENAEKRVVS